MKRLLLIGGNYAPEPTGIGKFNGEMMNWLVNNGYDCTVITSYPYYPQWEVQKPYDRSKSWYRKEETNDGRLKIYRCPQYVPAKPSGKSRIMLDFTFAISAFFKLMQLLPKKRYDLVISVVPAFHLGLLALLYKTLRRSKVLYHIQDLQIDAARDLNMIRSSRVINMMLGLERFILQKADYVSSISGGMMRKIAEKVNKEISFFPNWVDVERFYPLENRAQLKSMYGFNAEDKVVLYSGAIGEKQGLEAILHAAAVLNDVQFVICGSGPYKEKLKEKGNDLENVHFLPLQPLEHFNQFLNIADVHLIIQKASASDLVMPSKLTTVLAVGGVALITANPGSSLYELVKEHNIGVLVEAENPAALTEGIREAVSTNAATLQQRARKYAIDHLSISRVMTRFEETIVNR